MNKKHAPFVKAILYADIFDYPLKTYEVWKFMIGKAAKKDFEQFLTNPPSYVKKYGDYYFLDNRKQIVDQRLQRQKAGKKKLVIAQRACNLLAHIPTVQLIGISGGLSLLNADVKDDIDLFIITKKNTVWSTRLLVALLLELFGLRRKRNGRSVSDRICANMYLDEAKMQLSKEWRDLYMAHEVMQLSPLFSRHDTYVKFLDANRWVTSFLPNAHEYYLDKSYKNIRTDSKLLSLMTIRVIERFVRMLQEWYMNRHRTREVVSDTILAFHPVDYRANTLAEFAKSLKKYE
jgi:hypothetical protein